MGSWAKVYAHQKEMKAIMARSDHKTTNGVHAWDRSRYQGSGWLGERGEEGAMIRRRLSYFLLSAVVVCLLPLVGPNTASALPIDVDGCSLDVGSPCTLTPVQFTVDSVNGDTTHALVGSDFAKVEVTIVAIDPGTFQTEFVEFDYQYRIFDQQFTVTNFIMDLSLADPDKVLTAGFIDDGDGDALTVAPKIASYDRPDPITNPFGSGLYSAVFFNPAVTTDKDGSDVLFYRSTLAPGEITSTLLGQNIFDALLGQLQLEGLGSQVVSSAVIPAVPEPGVLLLIGSGLLGLGAVQRYRRHS